MLALTPTRLESWPLPPQVAVPTGTPQSFGPPTSGEFSMLRAKLKPGRVVPLGPPPMPPLSRLDHRVQTLCRRKLLSCLVTTASVQLANPVQKPVPASAASKKGCGVIAADAAVMPVQAV